MSYQDSKHVVVVGAGFSGLCAAYELTKSGFRVTILEAEPEVGGLAGAFEVSGEKLDKFYHHWFTNDYEVMRLIDELDERHKVEINPTNTGIYYANNFYKLSTPLDLLNFKPLNFFDRVRLGVLALRASRIKDWRALEDMTAIDWLRHLGGENVYRVVWEPLLKGKFGCYAEEISAVWFWNKLKLRGGSRGKRGEERLAYFKGGFVSLAESIAKKIIAHGGCIDLNAPVTSIDFHDNLWRVKTDKKTVTADVVIMTPALPLIADMIEDWAPTDYLNQLRRIKYIGNVCMVLELDRSLSNTYWLNVNDPSFPFVGVIEHTNFEKAETYGGRHIVYLSKYLPHTEPLYGMNKDEFLDFAFPYLKKMFPQFDRSWILNHHLWRARWSQPVIERGYSKLIPRPEAPAKGMYICSMAQIYPEDRGTNYAIREGRLTGRFITESLGG